MKHKTKYLLLFITVAITVTISIFLTQKNGENSTEKTVFTPPSESSETPKTQTSPSSPSVQAANPTPPSPTDPIPEKSAQSQTPRPPLESARDREIFYESANLIEQRETTPDENGVFQRIRILETDFKHPFIRIEETVTRNPADQSEQILKSVSMVADHFIVRLPRNVSEEELSNVVNQIGGVLQLAIPNQPIYTISLPEAKIDLYDSAKIALDSQRHLITYIEPDYIVHTLGLPNDPSFSQLWGLHNTGQTGGTPDADIDATEAWDISTGSLNVLVGVIDTGIDHNHVDLAGNMWINPNEIADNGIDDDSNGYIDDIRGWDFVNNDNNPMDDHYHGTHCAGTIGAVGNNDIGVVGVAHQISLVGLKFLSSGGSGSTLDAVSAVYYATSIGVDLTSNSWGGGGYSQSLKDAIDDAKNNNILFVAAAGNSSRDTDTIPAYPASYDSENIISVAALDHNDDTAYFTNYGNTTVDLGAPGVNIYSTSLNNSYRSLNGTSMACPHVAGACALIKSINPSAPWSLIKDIIMGSTDPVASLAGKSQTEGRLNIATAILKVSGPFLNLNGFNSNDEAGNDDNIINPDETIALEVTLNNAGSETASSVNATLSLMTSNPDISIIDGHSFYGDINAGAIQSNSADPFQIHFASHITTPYPVNFLLSMSDQEGKQWSTEIQLIAYSSSQISGTVTELNTGNPIPQASIQYTGSSSGHIAVNSDGTYTIDVIDGNYSLVASAPNFSSSEAIDIVTPPSQTNINFSLGYSQMQVNPLSLTSNQAQDTLVTQTLTLQNNGSLALEYSINAQAINAFSIVDNILTFSNQHPTDSNSLYNTSIPFQDSFEDGNFSDWINDGSSGTREVVSDISAHGEYSFHIEAPLANAHQQGIHHDFNANSRPSDVSFYVRSGSTLTSDGYFVLGDTSSYFREAIIFFANSDGTFSVNADDGGHNSYPYIAQKWYRIEFKNIDWSAKHFDYYVDGIEIQTEIPFRNAYSIDEFTRLYLYNFSESSEAWWDRITLQESSSFWLTPTPTSGSIEPGNSEEITVTFDSNNLLEGAYQVNIDILSNDPQTPQVSIPATMNVSTTPNAPPVAIPQTITSDEDNWSTISLSGTDPDNDALSAYILSLPEQGDIYQTNNGTDLGVKIEGPTLVSNPQNKIIFVPEPNAYGSPYTTFSFSVYDGRISSAQETVAISINPINDAPTAQNDYASGLPNQTLPVIPVLSNDSDTENHSLSITSFTQGNSGTVSDNGDNTFRYVPDVDFVEGSDQFTYTITDDHGEFATATVSIRLGNLMGGDWSQYRNDAGHSGYYPGSLGGKLFSLNWSSSPFPDYIHYAVAANGTAYVTLKDYYAEMPVYAYDMATGVLRWEYNSHNTVYRTTPPSVHDGRIFYTTAASGSNTLYAINTQSGQPDWQENYSTNNHYIGFGPTINADNVYFNDYYNIRAHSASTGTEVFSQTVPGNDYGWTPTVGDGQVFTFIDGILRSHAPDTGLVNRSLTINSSISGDYVVAYADKQIFIASIYGLYAVNTTTLTLDWAETDNSYKGTPAIANGRVFAARSSGYQVEAFDTNNGASLATYPTNFINADDIVVTDDTLFTASSIRTYIFDINTETLLQTLDYGGTITLYQGALLLNDYKQLYCLVAESDYNTPPIATTSTANITEDSLEPIQLIGSDAQNDALIAVITTLPSRGQLYQTPDGITASTLIETVPTIVKNTEHKLLYLPDSNGFGDAFDTLKFKMNDGIYYSNTATVSINITPINDAPTAINDHYTIRPGQSLQHFMPSTNDIDPDFDLLEIDSFTQTLKGTLVQNSDGSLSYTPNANFNSGTDSFHYTISDAFSEKSSAEVTITIDNTGGIHWPTFGNGPEHTGTSPIFFDGETLSLKWATNLGAALHQAAIADGRVYLSPSSSRFENNWLTALDENTGAHLWFTDLTFDAPGNYVNPPTYYDGRVLIQRGNSSSSAAGTPAESRIWCFDASTGNELWSSPVAAQWDQYFAPCAAAGSVWINGGYGGGMYGFDIDNGNQHFFTSLSGGDNWTPSYHKDKLYSFDSGIFINHEPLTGTTLWSLDLSSTLIVPFMYRTVAFHDDRAFLVKNGLNYSLGDLVAVDLSEQVVLWQQSESMKIYSTPAASNSVIYGLTSTGIAAYASGTGQLLATFIANDSGLIYQPIVTLNRVFAASNTTTYVFDLNNQELLQTIPFGGKISVANETLFIAGSDGVMRSYIISDPDNLAPVAQSITIDILEESQVSIPLIASDPEGSSLHYAIKTLPSQGKLFQTEDGSTPTTEITQVPAAVTNSLHQVIYQAPLNQIGNDIGNFTYAVIDEQTYSNDATVRINIININDAPIAVDDIFSVYPDIALENYNPTTNDIDYDSDILSITSFTQPNHGTVTQNLDGSLTFTPNQGIEEATDSFNYTISDPFGLQDTATITINISATLGNDWPTFGNGPQHSGYYPRTVGSTPLTLRWQTDMLNRPKALAIGNGRIYVTNVIDGFPGLSAIERSTGAEIWRKNLDSGSLNPINPPTYHNERVYLQRGNHNSDTQLWAFNAETGQIQWSSPHRAQWQSYYAPCVTDDSIWINGGSTGGMYGFDTIDGNERFFKGLAQYDEWTPSYHDGHLYSFVAGVFTNHDPNTGSENWSLDLGWDWNGWSMNRTVAFEGNYAYLINNSDEYNITQELVCIDLSTQQVKWRIAGNFSDTPAVAQSIVYAINDTQVQAYNQTSSLVQTYETNDTGIYHQPIISNDLVIISSRNQTFIFERPTGLLLQTIPLGGPISMAGDTLYIAGDDGTIQAWEAQVPNNSQPIAYTQAISTNENTPLTITLGGKDEDNDLLHFAIQSLPTTGKLYQTSDGITLGEEITHLPAYVTDSFHRVIYQPELNLNGDNLGNFDFAIGDGITLSTQATVQINVRPFDGTPGAIHFSPSGGTESTNPFAVTVTANDSQARIYFTCNGSAPDLDSPYISSGGTISIYRNTLVRAIAVNGAYISPIYQAEFTITDSDNDSIPDHWELAYFGNLTLANQSTDNDLDGFSDLNEFISDTSPVNPHDYFKIEMHKESISKTLQLNWWAASGRIYGIQATNDLIEWQRISPWIEGDNTIHSFEDDMNIWESEKSKRMYRITIE